MIEVRACGTIRGYLAILGVATTSILLTRTPQQSMVLAVVILAAGKGTRMRSDLPKVLHHLGERPLLAYGIDLAHRLSPEPPVLVVGHGAERVRAAVGDQALYAEQRQQLGTGHAVMQAEALLSGQADLLLVFAADMPLLTSETLRSLVATHTQHSGPITMLSFVGDDPRGFGRVVRDASGGVVAIVEEAEATIEQKAIRELNAGVYCFDAAWLWPALKRLQPSPAKGEYYLTDTIGLAVGEGQRVVAVSTLDPDEVMGINTREHLAEAEAVLRKRTNSRHMLAGVTMINPLATYIASSVQIGRDSVLWPGVCLRGRTEIGENCEVGPGAVLTDVILGSGCTVGANAVLTNLRAPSHSIIAAGAHVDGSVMG